LEVDCFFGGVGGGFGVTGGAVGVGEAFPEFGDFGLECGGVFPVFDGALRLLFVHEDLGHEFVVDGVVGVDSDGAIGGSFGFGEVVFGAEEFGEFAGDTFVFLFVSLEFEELADGVFVVFFEEVDAGEVEVGGFFEGAFGLEFGEVVFGGVVVVEGHGDEAEGAESDGSMGVVLEDGFEELAGAVGLLELGEDGAEEFSGADVFGVEVDGFFELGLGLGEVSAAGEEPGEFDEGFDVVGIFGEGGVEVGEIGEGVGGESPGVDLGFGPGVEFGIHVGHGFAVGFFPGLGFVETVAEAAHEVEHFGEAVGGDEVFVEPLGFHVGELTVDGAFRSDEAPVEF